MNQTRNTWVEDVLSFWFEELSQKDWFISTAELDETIVSRFTPTHTKLVQAAMLPVPHSAESSLAAVIVLDQFSRNMFRGKPEAFSFDDLALSFSKQSMHLKLDHQLDETQRMFLYMPFMHSESLENQKIALTLFAGKSKESADDHHELIKRFGRFPHRNAVLGRQSTAEEIEYLKNGKRFGQ